MNDERALTGPGVESKQNRRILIVDDNPAIHQDFRKILAGPGATDTELEKAAAELFEDALTLPEVKEFELASAYQGEEAVEKVGEALQSGRPFALAFMDVRMPPGIDGIETSSRLWKIDPELHIVICTAYSDYSLAQAAARLGASDRFLFLKKPFDTVEVKQMAIALTEKWRLGQEAKRRLENLDSLVAQRTRELTAANEKLVQDMAARKELEHQLRQAQKLEAIGQLAGGVAHDFNNLLTVIRGNTELALKENDRSTPQVCEYLNQVIAASDRASKLTRQLLAFSRKQVMQCEPLNLNEVLTNLSPMLSRIIGGDIRLRYACSPDLPRVSADPGMIEQVILNLVVNARDAIGSGGGLTISTVETFLTLASARMHSEARPGRFACLTVEDTGCGIAAEHLPHIFEPFFTTKEAGKGVGLGLATVHGIIKQHEGWIQVESRQGIGTKFVVFLPELEINTSASGQRPQDTAKRGGSGTALAVED